jgi:hypothetical protein
MKQIKQILETLKDSLLSGDVDFNEKRNIFESDTEKYFTYETEDKSTEFDIKISISDDLKSINYGSSCLIIKNKELVDDSFYLFSNRSEELRDLIDIIFINKIKPKIKIKDQESVFSDILNSIGNKSSRRDKKINEILNSDTDSVWKRIFNKN